MKNAKKLLGMVLSLCYVLSLFAGFSAAAAGEKNLLANAGDWVDGNTKEPVEVDSETGGIELTLESSCSVHSPVLSVEPNTAYTLTFEYSLPGTQLEYIINACDDAGNVGTQIVKWTKLAVTGDSFANVTVSFTTGDAVEKIKVRFATTSKGNTGSATVRYISVAKVENKATNGSFEAVDGEENVVGATGTDVPNSASTPALDGERMMVATKGTPITLELTLPEYSQNAKLRGYIKAVNFADSTATLTVKTAGGDVLAEKSFNTDSADTVWDIAEGKWEYVRMSALPYSGGMELEIKVDGEGSLYADGFTFENDRNLVRNAAFAPEGATDGNNQQVTWAIENTHLNVLLEAAEGNVYLNQEYKNEETGNISVVTQNGNCPDGQNYIEMTARTDKKDQMLLRTRSPISVTEGEKYRISAWIKGNVDCRFKLDVGSTASTAISTNYPGWKQFIVDEKSNDWKHVEFTLSVPKGLGQFNLNLSANGSLQSTDEDEYKIAFCMPVVEKITENEVGFYVQEFEKASTAAGGVSVVAPKLEPYGYAFQNVLGSPLETAIGFAGTITAVGITTKPQETSDDIVIMAAYKTGADGKKQLVNVSVGNQAAAPTWTTSVTDATDVTVAEADRPAVTGVNYPTATMHTNDLGDATEIRAYLWDGVSGLKPTGTAATIAR